MRTVSHHHSPFFFVLGLSTRFPLQFYSPHFLAVIIRVVSLLPLIYKDTIQKKIVFFRFFGLPVIFTSINDIFAWFYIYHESFSR